MNRFHLPKDLSVKQFQDFRPSPVHQLSLVSEHFIFKYIILHLWNGLLLRSFSRMSRIKFGTSDWKLFIFVTSTSALWYSWLNKAGWCSHGLDLLWILSDLHHEQKRSWMRRVRNNEYGLTIEYMVLQTLHLHHGKFKTFQHPWRRNCLLEKFGTAVQTRVSHHAHYLNTSASSVLAAQLMAVLCADTGAHFHLDWNRTNVLDNTISTGHLSWKPNNNRTFLSCSLEQHVLNGKFSAMTENNTQSNSNTVHTGLKSN